MCSSFFNPSFKHVFSTTQIASLTMSSYQTAASRAGSMFASSKPVRPSPPFIPTPPMTTQPVRPALNNVNTGVTFNNSMNPPMTTQPVRPALNNVNTGVTFNNSMNPPRGSIENSSTRTSAGKGPEQHQNINTGASWTTSGDRWQ
jgi:hypothetical protein